MEDSHLERRSGPCPSSESGEVNRSYPPLYSVLCIFHNSREFQVGSNQGGVDGRCSIRRPTFCTILHPHGKGIAGASQIAGSFSFRGTRRSLLQLFGPNTASTEGTFQLLGQPTLPTRHATAVPTWCRLEVGALLDTNRTFCSLGRI